MSYPLFKANLKSTWIFVTGLAMFMLMYVLISIAMFDPTSGAKMQQMFDMMPEGFLKAFGFDKLGAELTPYLSNYLYGFIMLIFPMIGSIVLGNNLVAKHVDHGSMAYMLTTPNTRIKIIITQAIYMILAIIFLFVVNAGAAIIYCAAKWPGELDVGKFMQLNVVTLMVALFVGGVTFLISCIFSDSKTAITAGAGIPILLFVAKMIADISDKVENLRYITPFSLVNVDRIISGDPPYVITVSLSLLAAVVVLYGAGIVIFNRKSLVI